MSNGQLVMHDITPRKLKTGGDPRTLADYATLRDELALCRKTLPFTV